MLFSLLEKVGKHLKSLGFSFIVIHDIKPNKWEVHPQPILFLFIHHLQKIFTLKYVSQERNPSSLFDKIFKHVFQPSWFHGSDLKISEHADLRHFHQFRWVEELLKYTKITIFCIFNPNFQPFQTFKPKTDDTHEFGVSLFRANRD